MTTLPSPRHRILLITLLAAVGCGGLAAGTAASADADGMSSVRPAPSAMQSRDDAFHRLADADVRNGDVPIIPPLAAADTNLVPGMLLDVWPYDREVKEMGLRVATEGPSLGIAVRNGDFFRYNSINSDPNLRSQWGEPRLLRWSGILQITEAGDHVFSLEFSKERGWGALEAQTLVMLNGETLYEDDVRVFGSNAFRRSGSRMLPLRPGPYRLEVWLAVKNQLPLEPSTRLGTYLSIRPPSKRVAEPLQASQVWHRERGRS